MDFLKKNLSNVILGVLGFLIVFFTFKSLVIDYPANYEIVKKDQFAKNNVIELEEVDVNSDDYKAFEIDDKGKSMAMGVALSDSGVTLMYILVILAVVGSLALPLVSAVDNPKRLLKTGISIAVVGLLFLICYSMADSSVKPSHTTEFGVDEGLSQFIGGVLNTTYILIFVGFAGWAVNTVMGILHKVSSK